MFGMDISGSAVRLVEMKIAKGRLRLEGLAVEPLPDGALADGKAPDQEVVSDAVGRAMRTLRTRARHAVVGLPPTAFVSKRVQLRANLSTDEMEFAVSTECQKFIAFQIADVNTDYQVLGPVAEDPDQIDVLIGAVQSAKVDDVVAMVEATGVKPYIVDSNTLAIQSALSIIAPPEEYPDGNIVYVHIGSQSTTMTVFRNGFPTYTKDQSFGFDQLTTDIMQVLNCEREVGRAIQHGAALAPDGYADVLAQFADVAGQEVARGYQLYGVTQRAEAALFVVGGHVAAMDGVVDAIALHTGVRAEVADPFGKFIIGPNVDIEQLAFEAPSLLTALGLALRAFDDRPSLAALLEVAEPRLGREAERSVPRPQLNLLPYRESRAKENRRQLGVLVGGVFVLSLCIGILVHGGFAGFIAQQDQRNAQISAANLKLDAEIGEINQLKDEIAALMARRKVIESLQADRAQTVQLMDQLVHLTPPGLYLTGMKGAGTKVEVTGYALSSDMVSAFMASIAESKYLERPELVEIRAGMVGLKRLNAFKLNFSLRRPELEDDKTVQGKSAGPMRPPLPKG
jgi:type IV pilus assembly protein PilM